MKKAIRILVPILLAALVIGSIGWYLFVYDRAFTRDMLLQQARYHDLHGNSRLSSWFYNLAYEHSEQDENVAIELANQYKADGNYTKAEVTLSNAINDGGTADLYIALCKTYVEQDKLLDAVSMLANISDSAIKAELEAMRPSAPAADYEAGFYSQYINVSLTSSSGTLYYTIDGDFPSTQDAPYSQPIELPAGETVIYAISVDDSGLVSPVTILGYTIAGVIEPAVFMDPAMEVAVRELLGKGDEILYTNELWEILEFTIPEDVTTLEDLSLMPYLETLTVSDKQIDSLSVLAALSKLETLELTGCKFPAAELSVLAGLPSLTSLTLSDCGLSTIAELSNVQNLTYLDLSGNTVRNMEPLSSMTTLVELNLQHNALTSLAALSPLTNLEKLDVSYNSVTSLAPIATCLKLNWLDAGNNQLTVVEGVDNLPQLTYLSVEYNKLTDISALAGCTGLTNLSISNNTIKDISSLSTLTKLDIFDFSYNEVTSLPDWPEGSALRVIDGSYNSLTSIDSLKKMENLSYVYMDYNSLTSVDAIADCFHLVQVNVYGNDIDDVSALTAHNIIVNYDPT